MQLICNSSKSASVILVKNDFHSIKCVYSWLDGKSLLRSALVGSFALHKILSLCWSDLIHYNLYMSIITWINFVQ